MEHEGILRDEGILPEERGSDSNGGRGVYSRIRMLLPTRLSTVLYSLIGIGFMFVLYRRIDLVEQVYTQGQVEHSAEPVTRHKSHIPSKVDGGLDDIAGVRGPQNDHAIGHGSEDDADGEKRIGNESVGGSTAPRFHLLVTARESSPNLCRTLLSAAALNYPPPVLIGYGSERGDGRDIARSIYGTHDFLNGGEVQDDDLTMIVEEGNWFQLPAEVTLGRFLRHAQVTEAKLVRKYGRRPPKIDLNSAVMPLGSPRYKQAVIFGAQKHCPNSQGEMACRSTPRSPLLIDIYGPRPDEFPGTQIDVPRYLGPSMAMGQVVDLRSVYNHSKELLEANTKIYDNVQQILAQIFGKQEYVRYVSADMREEKSRLPALASVPGDDHSIILGVNYEFGMGLDYMGSLFQVLHNSTTDMRFVTFKHPPRIAWPSLPSTSAFDNLIQLPQDLLTDAPFKSSRTFTTDLGSETDTLSGENITWSDIKLLTNIIIPTSSVPAIISFHGNETLQDAWWEKMWFQPYGRALLRRHVKGSREGTATKMAPEGAQRRWDYRPGKGDAWTENGTWLEWNTICGGSEREIFGDGQGRFEISL